MLEEAEECEGPAVGDPVAMISGGRAFEDALSAIAGDDEEEEETGCAVSVE